MPRVTLYRCVVRVSRGALLRSRGSDGHHRHEGGRAQQGRPRREDEEVLLYFFPNITNDHYIQCYLVLDFVFWKKESLGTRG